MSREAGPKVWLEGQPSEELEVSLAEEPKKELEKLQSLLY